MNMRMTIASDRERLVSPIRHPEGRRSGISSSKATDSATEGLGRISAATRVLRGTGRALLCATLLTLVASPALALTDHSMQFLGFGSAGYLSEGSSFEFDHQIDAFLDPGRIVTGIDEALLFVAVVDDSICDGFGQCVDDWFFQQELAHIDLNGVEWESGSATAQIFFGDVSAEAGLFESDGALHVSVTAEVGDFTVLWSRLATRYTYETVSTTASDDPGAPMPEPSAALVFAIGALFVRARVRQR